MPFFPNTNHQLRTITHSAPASLICTNPAGARAFHPPDDEIKNTAYYLLLLWPLMLVVYSLDGVVFLKKKVIIYLYYNRFKIEKTKNIFMIILYVV